MTRLRALIVSVATIIFSSTFQYVSWFNSVGVQHATDIAGKAARTYENSAAAIGNRHYAMLVFLPSLRDLVHAKANAVLSARAQVQIKGINDRGPILAQANAKKRNPDAEGSLLKVMARSTEDTKDNEISLHKSVLDIQRKRFASYYEQLKLWNENYDHLLSDIEYALDKPVFKQAGRKTEDFRVYRAKISQIDCLKPITEELQKLDLNPHSLKLRFAGIHNCFMEVHSVLDKQLTEASSTPVPTFSELTESQIKGQLDALLAMENEFRCYAHQRIHYYHRQKELADVPKTDALKHFEDAASYCNPQKRPV